MRARAVLGFVLGLAAAVGVVWAAGDTKVVNMPGASVPCAAGDLLYLDQGPGTDTKMGCTAANLGALAVTSNLADVNNAAASRGNLGIGSAGIVSTGTSGGTLGLLNANKTDSGNDTFSGSNTYSGNSKFTGAVSMTGLLSVGTLSYCMGLDGNNTVILTPATAGNCFPSNAGGGGGGGTPGGSANDVQYNNAGAFGGITLTTSQTVLGRTGSSPTTQLLCTANTVHTSTVTGGTFNILPVDGFVSQTATISATITYALPATTVYPTNCILTIADASGTASITTPINITPKGTDTINGLNSALALNCNNCSVGLEVAGPAGNWQTAWSNTVPPLTAAQTYYGNASGKTTASVPTGDAIPNSSNVWTIQSGAVTAAKMAAGAAAGNLGSFSGDLSGTPPAATIVASAVSVDKMANAAAGTVLGNPTTSSGVISATTKPLLGAAGGGTGSVGFVGKTSGTLTLTGPDAAGSNTIKLPAGTTDFTGTGGSSQVVKQTSSGGALTVARLACADLSDAAAGCSGAGVIPGTPATANITPVTVSANTASAQNLQELQPANAAFNTLGMELMLHQSGIISTAATSTVTLAAKLCTQTAGGGSCITLASVASTATTTANNSQFFLDVRCGVQTAGSSGKLICHGLGSIDLASGTGVLASSFTDGNTAVSSSFDLTGPNFILFTVAFGTASGSNGVTAQNAYVSPMGMGGTLTSLATTAPITGGTVTTTGTIACATCVTSSSPGAGIAHFAGGTQAVTSSAVALGGSDVSGTLPVANGGTASTSGAPAAAALSLTYIVTQINIQTGSVTATSTENKTVSVKVLGNTIGVNGSVEVRWLGKKVGTAGAVNGTLRFGPANDLTGTALFTNVQMFGASSLSGHFLYEFWNRGVANSQVGSPTNGFNSSTTTIATAAVDTTVDNWIVLGFTPASNNADVSTTEAFMVTIRPGGGT